MGIDIAAFQEAFFLEATELLDDLEGHLLVLEDRRDDLELLNTIFRCAHSIKGGSATFGFPQIAEFTHDLETLLDKVRSGKVPVTPDLCQVMFMSLDQMRLLLANAMGNEVSVPDSSELTSRIVALSEGSVPAPSLVATPAQPQPSKPVTYWLSFAPGQDVLRTGNDPCLLLNQICELGEILQVERDETYLPPLSELDPESCYLSWRVKFESSASPEEILEIFDFVIDDSLVKLTPVDSEPAAQQAPVETIEPKAVAAPTQTDAIARTETATLRVAAEKVDRLVDLVGELVISQAMLSEVTKSVDLEAQPKLMEAVASVERACRELQERIMGIRLVQLKLALARFPRLVRDQSAAAGKKIELVMVGEETELDKSLIEMIGDPLTHLVRNSIDHGLETPAERISASKGETGTLLIQARYEGGNVVIELSDDGRGLNRDRILAKAIERGLASETDSLTDEAIYNFIFHPGLSTAAKVSDLSGRGVGMDIVRQSLQHMNGSITVSTNPGQGTTFRIRLPLTMAIIEGLSLSVGKEVYILPLTNIVESLRPEEKDLFLVAGNHEVVRVRGEVMPLLRLHELFHAEDGVKDPCQAIVVIVESDGRRVALLVDELITQNQAVIKSLESNYRRVDGITGATILGDGRVALIIDVPGLLRGVSLEGGTALRAA